MLTELLALALVPAMINQPNFLNGSASANANSTVLTLEQLFDFERYIEAVDDERVELSSSALDRNSTNPLPSPFHGSTRFDPLLAEVLAEEKRLNLAFEDDYFDHLEDQSEEVRELIRARQDELLNHPTLSTDQEGHTGNSYIRSRSRTGVTDQNGITTSTQYSILIPPNEQNEIEIEPTTAKATTTTTRQPLITTKKPNIFNSALSNINQGVNSVASVIVKPFAVGRSLSPWGKPTPATTTTTTTTTTTPLLPPPETLTEALNCPLQQTVYQGACYNVFQEYPCKSGEWLIEDQITGNGKCVINLCSSAPGKKAYYGGQCIDVGKNSSAYCHQGMTTLIYKSGVVECDCKAGHLYNDKDGSCYPAYRQGPCASGQYFIIPKKTKTSSEISKGVCMPNSCITDGFYCNAPKCPNKRGCVQLGSNCTSSDGSSRVYRIKSETNTPYCLEPHTGPEGIIGNVPTLSCAPGTRRDILGNCRAPADITFS